MYERHDIEEMLKSYLIKSAQAKELQRKIEANNVMLEYGATRLIETDNEIIKEMALATPKIDNSLAKTNKISNSTERIALSYKSKLVRINEADKLRLISENANYYEKLSPLLEVVNKVNIMLSSLNNEQKLVIETYYFHEPKWDYVANVYYDVYKQTRTITRLKTIRNIALDIMEKVINV